MHISKTTMQRILKFGFGFEGLQNAWSNYSTEDQQEGDDNIFSEEKIFLLQDNHNQQNNRVYFVTLKNAFSDKL